MRAYFVCSLLVIIGLGMLLGHAHLPPNHWASLWLSQLASAVLISGVLGFIDKLVLNRDMIERVSVMFNVATSIRNTGLEYIEVNANSFDYSALIEDSSSLSMVMNDGRTWISDKITHFQQRFARKRKTELLVLDPDSIIVESVAAKTGYSLQEQRDKIRQAINRIVEEFEVAQSKGALVVRFLKFYPTHALFMTDDKVVLTLYGISGGRRQVPAFVFANGDDGRFAYDHIRRDLEALRDESEWVYDSEQNPRKGPRFPN